jgi:hypothetical protein
MASYYVNNDPQTNGDHEVHKEGCSWMPTNRKYLGEFSSCQPAVQKAKDYYVRADGCHWCCPECDLR